MNLVETSLDCAGTEKRGRRRSGSERTAQHDARRIVHAPVRIRIASSPCASPLPLHPLSRRTVPLLATASASGAVTLRGHTRIMQQRCRRTGQRSTIGSLSTMAAILLLASAMLLLSTATVAAAPTYTDPEYTYHIAMGQSLASQTLPTDLVWTRSTVTDVDDCYYQSIDLAFAFPYWLRSFRTLSISPNGALYIPPDPVGCSCRTYINGIVSPTFMVAVPCQCCFDNAFFDLIAASLTDLFPSIPAPNNVAINYAQTNTSFFVNYVNVPLYTDQWNVDSQGPVPTQSFSVELRSNGRIITRYTHIDDVFTFGNYVQDRSRGTWIPRNWLVGLRQADPRFSTSLNPSSKVTRNKVQWNATTNAVYPPRATIRSGTTINYWPVGSVACNSPSIGTPTRTDTYIYLNDFARRAADFNLRCWVSVSGVTVASVPAIWNSTLGALKCTLPQNYPLSTLLTLNLAEEADGIFLPLSAMSFRIYADGDPVIQRYDALASRTGGGADLRVCYECARLRPQQCQAPLLSSMCNTPQIGSTDGTTSTVVLASGYSWSDRLASGALKQLWCVWSNPSSAPDERDPNGLNPFLFEVSWVAARLYSNASGWIICDPPIPLASAGTTYNLSLAEGNFVWVGGLGAVGGGWGYASPLDNAYAAEMASNTRAAMQAAAGNKQILMSYTVVPPGDTRLLAYEADDYLNDYLLAPSSNFSSGVGSKAGLNLKQLCSDCRSRVASLVADSSTAASSITGATGVCLDAAAASVNLCISPPFGDAAGASIAGANATFNLFLSNYPTHIRRSLFALSCALQPYYIRNDSSIANVTVVNGTQSYVELRTTFRITYLSVGDPTFVPLLFDASRSLYSCEAPSLASLDLGALSGMYANVSQDSVLVLIAENNLVLPGFPQGIVYTFVASTDARLQELEAGRQSVPQSPPWSFCFSCDPLFRSVSFTPNAGFITDSRGLSYCFGTAAVTSLPSVRICASPAVGGKQADSNNTVSLWTTSLYPLATRLVMSSVYCVFSLPATYTSTFNSTTNVTTTVTDEPAIPPLWVPVSYRNLEQRSATCVPPAFGSVFGSNVNLTVGLAEFGLILPFAPQLYQFLEESDEDLVILRQHQALLFATSQALDGSAFSPQQFCTDCHATSVLAGPTFVPLSPVGVAGLCYADCAKRWNGAAVYDDCGVCSAGHSGHSFNAELDCMSVCSGPFLLQTTGAFQDCRCENRPECFNISTQPLVGVSILPEIPGRPRPTPLDLAAVSSQQFLLRTFALSPPALVVNDPSASLTPDPDFNSTGFLRFAPSNWLGSGDGSGFAADPYPIAVGFQFPFFERAYSTVYLSSSGAIMFAPQSSYPDVCKRAPSSDPRVKNLGLLAALFAAPGDFATGCAEASAILAYATFLDPSANISSPFPGAFALGSMPTQTPAATVAYMVGPAADAATSDAAAVAAGRWISFKFENVPYNFPAFAPWAARYASAPAVADTKPPLYSFQITLYASGRISLKYLAVTDPADPSANPAFNTTDGFKSLVVGLLDRKLPASSLSQSAPQDSYVAQLERGQGASFGLQGALALRSRQHQWLPNSSVSIGVFPPRNQVASAIQQVFCPFALNACAYPPAGPSTGGTLVSVNLFNLGVDRGCIERLLSIQCVFGDVAASSQSTYDPATNTLHCLSPAGTALVTVPLLLMEGGTTLITTNKLFWTWFAVGDPRLDVREYDERANTTWIGHLAGLGETAGVANAQSVASYQREMCTACHAFNPGYCVADCNQVYFGTAFVDDCGYCTAGQTGREPNFARDCGGVCSGLARTFTSGGESQCACAPIDDLLCGAAAIPTMNPAPSQSLQFVYHVRTEAATANSPMEPLPVDWDGSPVGSIELLAPLPEYLTVPVPFLFPFYAQLLSTVHISGWGTLLLAELSEDFQAPCLSRGLEVLFRNTTTNFCPFQLVAPSLMEFDLAASGASIKYYSSTTDVSRSACFTVVWKNMVAASDASLHYTFAVQLCDAGQITFSYREVHDPNAAARAVAPLPPVKFVPNATVALPLAPDYALSAPFWLAGVMQSWYRESIVHIPQPGVPVTPRVLNPDGSVMTLTRENVVPFPYSQTQITLAVIEQRAFLGLSGPAAPLGTFHSRAQLHMSGTGSQWQYCRLGVDFCVSVNWGPVEGGTLVRIFGSDWGCRSFGSGGSNETRCCAEQLQLECDFGGVRVPANFSSTMQAVQCVSPPAVLHNSSVVLTLSDSGRRIGMRQNFVFRYNVTNAELATPSNPDLIDHALWYNTDASICSACRSIFSSSLLNSNAFCATDCYDVFRGSAALDGCGVCAGGTTGRVAEADRDCRGECFGPFRRVADSDGPLLDSATSQVRASLADQCICVDSSAVAAGLPSCGYYPVLDGPIQASQVFRFAPYEFMLVALAAGGIVGAAAWQVFVAVKYGAAAVGGGAGAGPAAGAGAAQPPPPPPPAPSQAQRRAQRAAAAGLMGVAGGLVPAPGPAPAPAPAEPVAADPAPAAAASSAPAPSRRRAAAAAAASPAMSGAASAALGGGSSSSSNQPSTRPARVHPPPASHYQYSAAPRQ